MIQVFDGHNDTLLRLRTEGGSFFERSAQGHVDLPRAREGGLAGGFCAMFVRYGERPLEPDPDYKWPTPPLDYSQQTVRELMEQLRTIEQESEGQVRVVLSVEDIERCLQDGVFAALMHVEGAEAIDTDLTALEDFHQEGLRSLGLAWSRPNAFAQGVPFQYPHSPDTGPGLTDAGKELVQACNQLRVMMDLSHLNEQGFWDVASLTEAPLVATHSNAHALCPATRNLTDKQLDAIGESDGMVGVNFATYFLDAERANEEGEVGIEAIVRHVDYLVDRIGIDRVGFGSDFDGANIPSELGDVTGLPHLVAALGDRGYDDQALGKLTHRNWLRALRLTWGE